MTLKIWGYVLLCLLDLPAFAKTSIQFGSALSTEARSMLEEDLQLFDDLEFVDNDGRLGFIFFPPPMNQPDVYRKHYFIPMMDHAPKWQFSLFRTSKMKHWLESRIGWITTCIDTSIPHPCVAPMYELSLNAGNAFFESLLEKSEIKKKNPSWNASKIDKWLAKQPVTEEWNLAGVGLIKPKYLGKSILRLRSSFFKSDHATRTALSPAGQRVYRIAALFHGARFTDGLQYSYVKRNVEGLEKECDAGFDGPFTVEAVILKSLIQSCRQCSDLDKTLLKQMVFRAAGRIPEGNILDKKGI